MSSHTLTARERKSMDKVLANLARPDSKRGLGDVFLMRMFGNIEKFRAETNVPEVSYVRIPENWTRHFLLNFRVCDMCQKPNHKHSEYKMLCCSKCKIAHYCSLQCQRNHWEEHKDECSEMYDDKELSDIMAGIFRCKTFLSTLLMTTLCFSVGEVENDFLENLERMNGREIYEKGVQKNSLVGKALKEAHCQGDAFVFFASDGEEGREVGLSMAVFDREELQDAAAELFHMIMHGLKCKAERSMEDHTRLKMHAKILSETVKNTSKELPEKSVLMGFAMKGGPVVWVVVDFN